MSVSKYKNRIRLGKVQRKILLIIGGSVLLGLSRSPKRYSQIFSLLQKEWQYINRQALERALGSLEKLKLIDQEVLPRGEILFKISNVGEKYSIAFSIDEMKLKKPPIWDKRWRIVMFDIPERLKKVRESLRFHLKQLEFFELQKSAFVVPYECKSEIEFITIFYRIGKFTRFIVADSIDNEMLLRRRFKLPLE